MTRTTTLNATAHKVYQVLIVDDHPILRDGLTLLINREPDLQVCGEASDAREGLDLIASKSPDIVILDIALPGLDGLDFMKMLRSSDQHLPVLMLSMHDEAIYAERALRAGANGYVMKQEATENVLAALRKILQNGVYVSERIANKVMRQVVSGGEMTQPDSISSLSDRELEVFRLIGEGNGTRDIADQLHLSVKTVESYQANIKTKLSLNSGRDLMRRAIEWRMREDANAAKRK